MIVTLTANPSLDRTVVVEELVRGAVLRTTGHRVDPGGKGVNVSRALAAHGVATLAVLPCGGAEGDQLVALLRAEGVEVAPVRVAGTVRANVTVAEPDGTTTKLNEPGPQLTATEIGALVAATLSASRSAGWVVLSGSLPPGAPDDLYAALLRRLDARVAVDTGGASLPGVLAARPALVKPNREELAEATGLPVGTVGEALAAARRLRALGAGAVLASLGVDGALLVDDTGEHFGEAAVDSPLSTVGAGDAALAGFLAAGGGGPAALAEALAWGAAAVSLPGSRMPRPADLRRSDVRLADSVPTERDLKGRTTWQT